MIFGYVGAQGSQKTTRANAVVKALNLVGANATLVEEIARKPKFVTMLGDAGLGFDFQMATMEEQIWDEQKATARYDVVVCDRTVIDYYCYGYDGWAHGLMTTNQLQSLWDMVVDYLRYNPYDMIYHCIPKMPPADDGVRSTDVDFQKRMERVFHYAIKELRENHGLKVEVLT